MTFKEQLNKLKDNWLLILIGVVVFGFLVFPVNAKALEESQLTPYCIKIAKAAYSLIPQELKEKFNEAYQ